MTLFDLLLPPLRRLVARPRPPLVPGLSPSQDRLLRLLTRGWTVRPDCDWDRLVAIPPGPGSGRRVRAADVSELRGRGFLTWTVPVRGCPMAAVTAAGQRAVADALLSRQDGGLT